MSLLNPAHVACPHCGTENPVQLAASINADRRPDLRQAILDDTFQVVTCTNCGGTFRLTPGLTYADFDRGAWIVVRPPAAVDDWALAEAQARATFDSSYGAGAPAGARDLGAKMTGRVVFGWPALREKLLAAELGLNDAELELLKLAVMRDVQGSPLSDESELRLTGGDAETLHFAWYATPTGAELTTLAVPRAIYDGVAGDAAWAELRGGLAGQLFVDIRRLQG